ncbi:MAG: hypothetical protein WCT04_21480 [Planctomycetota bacterium]
MSIETDTQSNAIRRNTHTGLPCGGEAFVERQHVMLGRVLLPQRAGRKKKKSEDDGRLAMVNE